MRAEPATPRAKPRASVRARMVRLACGGDTTRPLGNPRRDCQTSMLNQGLFQQPCINEQEHPLPSLTVAALRRIMPRLHLSRENRERPSRKNTFETAAMMMLVCAQVQALSHAWLCKEAAESTQVKGTHETRRCHILWAHLLHHIWHARNQHTRRLKKHQQIAGRITSILVQGIWKLAISRRSL